jgi:hypothetical protein
MAVTQILEQEIKDSELWLSRTQEESTYKRDLKKRIELIKWVLGNMKNPNVEICSLIESRMNETYKQVINTNGTVDDFLKSLPSDNTILAQIVCQSNSNDTR